MYGTYVERLFSYRQITVGILHFTPEGCRERQARNLRSRTTAVSIPLPRQYIAGCFKCHSPQYVFPNLRQSYCLIISQGEFNICPMLLRTSMEFGTGCLHIVGSRCIKALSLMKLHDGQNSFP